MDRAAATLPLTPRDGYVACADSLRYTIPKPSTERRTGPFDRAAYRRRHLVENLFARCKQYRALATRYDERGDSFRTAWVIVLTILWLPE